MKLPSFVKVAKYKQFNFEPRYYDSVKEEIKNRTRLIEQDIKNTRSDDAIRSRITDAFARDRRKKSAQVSFAQFVMVILLSAAFVGYLYFDYYALIVAAGFIVLYILWLRGDFDRKRTPAIETDETPVTSPSAADRLAGKMREGRYFPVERGGDRGGWYRLLILLAALIPAGAYYFGKLDGTSAFLCIFILLILFIRQSSKAR